MKLRIQKAAQRMEGGFTLIELLIVVAIIAILAAIAVPNFLEAQTRSKVSRVKSDMRSIGIAAESYSIDYNRYPIGYNEGKNMGLWDTNSRPIAYNRFTTPVAYLTSIPIDPFAIHGQLPNDSQPIDQQLETNMKWQRFEYHTFYIKNANNRPCLQKGYYYMLSSPGPSRRYGTPWHYAMINGSSPPTNVYDASNGTVSYGAIHYSNKGFFTGANI